MITEEVKEAPPTTLSFDRVFSTEGQDPFDSVSLDQANRGHQG